MYQTFVNPTLKKGNQKVVIPSSSYLLLFPFGLQNQFGDGSQKSNIETQSPLKIIVCDIRKHFMKENKMN